MRSARARNLLLARDIDGNDFEEFKVNVRRGSASQKVDQITSSPKFNSTRLEVIVDRAFDTLWKVDRIYKNADDLQKRRLIGSMFVEKFTFEDHQHRTAKMAEYVEYIVLINTKLETKKMGQKNFLDSLSHQGSVAGHFSQKFIEGLIEIAEFEPKDRSV